MEEVQLQCFQISLLLNFTEDVPQTVRVSFFGFVILFTGDFRRPLSLPINIKAIKVILTERKAMNELIWQITIKFHYKYGVIYREILTTPEFELCTLAHKLNYDRSSINRLTLTVLDILTNSVPGLIHECPYEVRVKVFI